MPHDQVVIGYSPHTGARRTVSVLDYPWQVPVHAAWMKSMGEAVLIGTLSDYRTIGPDAMLARHLGRPHGGPAVRAAVGQSPRDPGPLP